MTRARLVQGTIALVLLGSFGVALLRGDSASIRVPSKEEWLLKTNANPPPEPTSLADFLGVGSHLGVPRAVAIVSIGPITGQHPGVSSPRPGPVFTSPSGVRRTPPPLTLQGPSTDYAARIDEVLSPSALRPNDTVTLRYSGPPTPGTFTPFPHPLEGERLLLVLVADPREPANGAFITYPYGTANITGPTAHLADGWRTSVSEMGAPTSTPAFIEAVRAALR